MTSAPSAVSSRSATLRGNRRRGSGRAGRGWQGGAVRRAGRTRGDTSSRSASRMSEPRKFEGVPPTRRASVAGLRRVLAPSRGPIWGLGDAPATVNGPSTSPGRGPPGPKSVPTSTRRAHSGHRPPLPRDEHEHEYQEGWKERRLRAARAQLVAARGSLPWGSRDSSRSACCSRPGPPGGALEQGGRHRVELPPVPVRPADSNAPGFVSTRGDATLRPSSWIGPQCPTSAGAGGGTSRGR
jgi:hypothetical protein